MQVSPEFLSAAALLVTAVVGFLSYRTRERTTGAETAIRGLDLLAARSGDEIQRLEKRLAACESDRQDLHRKLGAVEGQLEVLRATLPGVA